MTQHMNTAMILAAGRGKRMGTLTEHTPKPLIKVNDKVLIEFSLMALAKANIEKVIINVAYKAQEIIDYLGDGSQYGLKIIYSLEPEGGYETAGGVMQALPLLGDKPFLLLSADIYCELPLESLALPENSLAHLVLVANPEFNPNGDYALTSAGEVCMQAHSRLNYAGIAVFHPQCFKHHAMGFLKLRDVLSPLIAGHQVTGMKYNRPWYNVGSPKQLQQLQEYLHSHD